MQLTQLENKEYNALRQEVLEDRKIQAQLFTVGLTITVTIWAIGSKWFGSTDRSYIFLFSLVPLFFFQLLIFRRALSANRKAGYIMKYFEDRYGKGWEKRLSELRGKARGMESLASLRSYTCMAIAYFVLAVISTVLGGRFLIENLIITLILALLVMPLLTYTAFLLITLRKENSVEGFYEKWKNID